MLRGTSVDFIAALLVTGTLMMPARAAQDEGSATASIPDFSGTTTGWMAMGTDFKQGPGGPPMVTNDPAHPHIFGQDVQETFKFADLNNPNLTEFAKESLKKTNDRVLQGKTVFAREARCWPTGVPTYLLNLSGNPVYFIQTPKEVVMIWQMDHQVRHVYLNVPHAQNPQPSWYGESVGHYEGDTLVVDTIRQNTMTFVDNYRTPHSERLHVVERFHLINDGKNLQADVTLEDSATFKEPLQVFQTWRRVEQGPMIESSCAEAGGGYFSFEVEPVPTAEMRDF